MMDTMNDLVEWLRVQLDDDERMAKAAALSIADHTYAPADAERHRDAALAWRSQPWLYHKKVVADGGTDWQGEAPKVTDSVWEQVGDHIARHDPARVLREVEAKRRILDEYEKALDRRRLFRDDVASAGALLQMVAVVKLLALPYVDRPGYREEWRP